MVSTSRLGLGLGSKTLWESGLACLTYQSFSQSVLQYSWVMTPVVAMGKATDCGTKLWVPSSLPSAKGPMFQLSGSTCFPST